MRTGAYLFHGYGERSKQLPVSLADSTPQAQPDTRKPVAWPGSSVSPSNDRRFVDRTFKIKLSTGKGMYLTQNRNAPGPRLMKAQDSVNLRRDNSASIRGC